MSKELTPWEKMQEHRKWAQDNDYVAHLFCPPDPAPKAARVGPWWFRDSVVDGRKWHYAQAYRGYRVEAACGHRLIESDSSPCEWEQRPPIQACCTNCLGRLAKLPLGTFPDDPEARKNSGSAP